MTRRMLLAVSTLAIALGACEADRHSPPVGGTSGAPSALAATAAASTRPLPGSQYRDEDLPVEADFEEQAEQAIGESNHRAELDRIEKDLDAAGEPTAAAPSARRGE
jgi:hypothetical protein